jgi:2,5-furandicarboxylate decarboxylase 1
MSIDDRFRLRSFLETLREVGEVETHEAASLDSLTALMEGSDKALYVRHAGPEGVEIVGGIMGSRARMALAFETDPRALTDVLRARLATSQQVTELPRGEAPVQQVVWRGRDIDLRRLPFHLQHDEDGGVYISSALDFCIDPETGSPNQGSRRLFLRSRNTVSTNLSAPSDLRRIYHAAVARNEALPVNFVIGAHPLDFVAAGLRVPGDEFELIARVRGATLPMVRGVSNDIMVPADAELVIETFLDPRGHILPEGPYGEFWGLYGEMHINPIVRVTAITAREDVLHQTVAHGSRFVSRMEASYLAQIACEAFALRTLNEAQIKPTAVYASPNVAVNQHVRIALPRGTPGEARRVIDTLHTMPGFRYVQVVDDEVDVFSDEESEWAISTRFRADRDLIVTPDLPGIHADPTRDAARNTAKMGLDCTMPYDLPDAIEWRRPSLPDTTRRAAEEPLRILGEGPKSFRQVLERSGDADARDVAMALETLLQSGRVKRVHDGKWALS